MGLLYMGDCEYTVWTTRGSGCTIAIGQDGGACNSGNNAFVLHTGIEHDALCSNMAHDHIYVQTSVSCSRDKKKHTKSM